MGLYESAFSGQGIEEVNTIMGGKILEYETRKQAVAKAAVAL
ncbi:MAG: hypothetical protein ACI4HI_05210 [Lachnospiraceae bacterium]